MSIFGPASPETQVLPVLKAQQDHVTSQIPSVLKDQAPKEQPTNLFQSYLDTGNDMFKSAASKAMNELSMFKDNAVRTAQNFPDSLLPGGVTYYQKPEQPTVAPSNIAKVQFAENTVPTVHLQDGTIVPIDKVALQLPQYQPLSSLSYTQEQRNREGKLAPVTVPVTDSSQLAMASKIKAIGDSINPQYSNYLVKAAINEGQLKPNARNYNFNDGTSGNNPDQAHLHGGIASVDRGIFQINNKAFPQITDQMADNPELATLFAISMIDAGKQSKWSSNAKNKEMRVSYQ